MSIWTPRENARLLELETAHQTRRQIARALSSEFGRPITMGAIRDHRRRMRERGAEIPVEVDLSEMRRRDAMPPPAAEAFEESEPGTQPFAPVPETERPLDESLGKLLELAKRRDMTLEGACDELDLSPGRVRSLIEQAKESGYNVDLAGPHIGMRPRGRSDDEHVVALSPTGGRRIFAVASDIHVGSKYFLRAQFEDFIHRAYERGARVILGPGDILDGCYKHSRWDEYAHGFDEQARDAARVFPRLPGLSYAMIAGNHDQTFETDSGLSFCRALEEVFKADGRDDLTMLGSRGAYVRMLAPGDRRGLLVDLWHPLGGGAYAVSYKLQKHVEGYAPGSKPDALFCGHFHQQAYACIRGVHAFQSGTFHGGQSAFGKALGGSPAIGGWIVEYAQTEEGTVREMAPTWVSYYEREGVRDVGLS